MTPRIAGLSVAAVLGLAAAAPAQVMPYGGYGYPYGGPRYPGVPFNLPLGGGLNFNPVLSPGGQFLSSGVLPFRNGVGIGPGGLYVSPRYSGPAVVPGGPAGFGGGYLGPSDGGSLQPVLGREQRDLAAAQAEATFRALSGETQRNVERWVADQTRADAPRDPLTALDPALIQPTEDALVSGQVLNDLAARIIGLEAKGRRAKPGLCPPELLEKVAFAGGTGADLLSLFRRPAEPILPAALPAGLDAEPLTRAYAAVAASLFAGRKATPADAAKLREVTAQLRAAVDPHAARAPIAEAGRWLAFFTALDSAAKFAAEPAAAEVLSAKWPSVGANVSDLVRQVTKAKARFGRAAAGDELSYHTIHRAMLGYYAALTQAK